MNLSELTEMIEAKNQLKRSHEKLAKYESELISKEQNIKAQEKDLKLILHAISEEKTKLAFEKQELEKKLAESDILAYDQEGKEQKFKKEQDAFKVEKTLFHQENQEILALKAKIEKTVHETEKIYAANVIQNAQFAAELEKLEEEKVKFFQEREKFEQDLFEFSKEKENLRFSQKNLELEKSALESDRHEVQKKMKHVKQEQEKLQNDLENIEKLRKRLEIQKLELNLLCETNLSAEAPKIKGVLNSLQQAMEVYNEEVTVRELKLAQKQAEIERSSEKLLGSMVAFKQMHESLKRTKHEIYVFYTEVVPELEMMSAKSKSLEQGLKQNFKKIESLYLKMVESALRLASSKDYEVTFMNFHEKNFEHGKKVQSEYLFDHKNVDELTKELIARVKNLCLREKELEKQVREQKQISVILGKAKESILSGRKELESEREKVNDQGFLIEQAIKSLQSKEYELKLFKQELDKRVSLLRAKENQMEVRMFQMRELQQSTS